MSDGQLVDGKYELVAIAGEGGMATVYRARARGAAGFARTVAIKRIRPEYRAIKNYVDMFIEEARVGAELAHPNIVQVYDFISAADGSYYLVMEWIDGIDLGSFIQAYDRAGRPLPWRLVTEVGIGTARGLSAAHERRDSSGNPAPVIHRDVSPHNVLLATNGMVKLTDFGLARARDRVYSLTAPGTVKGKLSYLSPEVSWGKEATPLSDQFSLGCVLWEALTATRLFEGRTDLDVFRKLRACDIPSLGPLRPDLPPRLVDALARALSKDAADRFPSVNAFARELGEILASAPHSGDAQQALGHAVIDARALVSEEAASLRDDGDGRLTPTAPRIRPGSLDGGSVDELGGDAGGARPPTLKR